MSRSCCATTGKHSENRYPTPLLVLYAPAHQRLVRQQSQRGPLSELISMGTLGIRRNFSTPPSKSHFGESQNRRRVCFSRGGQPLSSGDRLEKLYLGACFYHFWNWVIMNVTFALVYTIILLIQQDSSEGKARRGSYICRFCKYPQ
jgi:hypothetical protein